MAGRPSKGRGRRGGRLGIVALPVALLALLLPGSASAAPLTVTTNADMGAGSLRAALTAASPTGPDTISFTLPLPATINLASELPLVSPETTVNGPGSSSLTVRRDTGGDYPVLHMGAPAVGEPRTAAISGITLSNGTGVTGRGGGIYDSALNLTLTDVTLSDNTVAMDGGAIFTGPQNITLVNSKLTGNAATAGEGGGIWHSGNLTLVNSTVDGNTAGTTGGGIRNYGDLLLDRSTLSYNHAHTHGGAVANGGSLTAINSTFSGNRADDFGGAIDNFADPGAATANLNSVTFDSNNANFDMDGSGNGGGIQQSDEGAFALQNVLFGFNAVLAGAGTNAHCSGTFVSLGHNLRGSPDPGCVGLTAPGDVLGSTGLGVLGPNGGPTQTVPLEPGSAAIGSGSPGAPTIDQRGVSRPQGTGCDIGAFELETGPMPGFNCAGLISPPPPAITPVVSLPTTPPAAKKCKKGRKLKRGKCVKKKKKKKK